MNFPMLNGIYLLIFLASIRKTLIAGDDVYYFRYAIESGDVISQHWEERMGDIVRGAYSFLEPNGKIRVVDYQSTGQNGFKASVTWRNPPTGNLLRGHLMYPLNFHSPVVLAQPVNFITRDLFQGKRTYPNLP